MKRLLCILLLLPLFGGTCLAEDVGTETAQLTEIYEVEDQLGEEEREISGDLSLDGSYDAKGALGRLWDRLLSAAGAQLRSELRFAALLVSIALLCSLVTALCPGKRIPDYMEIAACSAAALLLGGSLESVLSQATESLAQLSSYARVVLPAFYTTVAACGAVTAASVKYASVCFAMDLFMSLSQRLILPLISAFLAVSVSGSLFENPMLSAVGRVSKWCALTAMTVLTTAFCLFISLSGLIAGSADAAAVKTTKTVIATALPVVGGILSDSAASMLAAASVIKNSAGVFSLIAVCALCVGPFVLLSVKMLVFKLSAAVSELACGGRYARLLGNMGTAFGMLLGLVGCYGMMLFLSIMSGLRAVSV